ncbi:lysosomal-trafficking regulator [Salvelinus sp. IW2-2015]|uniref:lysosomal-trafficking regulator n=1 Tax=Salvelinus sp. IW2-2015 TaxID=2691554 RepID=UPI0038D3E833
MVPAPLDSTWASIPVEVNMVQHPCGVNMGQASLCGVNMRQHPCGQQLWPRLTPESCGVNMVPGIPVEVNIGASIPVEVNMGRIPVEFQHGPESLCGVNMGQHLCESHGAASLWSQHAASILWSQHGQHPCGVTWASIPVGQMGRIPVDTWTSIPVEGPSPVHFIPQSQPCPVFIPRVPALSRFIPRVPALVPHPFPQFSFPRVPALSRFMPTGPALSRFIPRVPALSRFIPRVPALVPFHLHGSQPMSRFHLTGPALSRFIPRVPALSRFIPRVPALSRFIPRVPALSRFISRVPALSRFISRVPALSRFISRVSFMSRFISQEQLKYEADEKSSKLAWEKKISNTQKSLIQRLDGKSKDISKIAADITQNVSLRQGMERKKVIQHIRGLYKIDLSASRHWQELVQQLTHDRAVWYDQMSYPTSWQLDPTEGPNRERRRLQRCYLTIPNKYLLKDRRKPDDPAARAPLSFLFEDKTHSSFSSTVKDKATSEPIRFTRRCISVAPSRETSGELLLGKSGMYFVEDNAADAHDNQSVHGETEAASFSWTYEEIKEVHKRWWQLRDNAVEIFLTNGRTLLLAFHTTKFRDDVYHNILTSDLPNLLEYGNITALTHLWGSGQISNFEYLTHLNKHSGRSFNDLMQYPVFPFILKDYISETLDLGDSAIYRNLNKPIAVQSKEKEDRYVDNYKYLEEEYRKGAHEDDPMPPVQPYHYGSHYSNSGTVLHFLVRMPPFTKMFLAYQGFDFGVRQNSERVNHVNLPPWARNDPRLFILIHRQALESDQVSQTLCQWIDLVFGLKQKGKAAVHAINVFHPATYFGMDVSSVEDPVQRRALETMIKTYGQTPRQLFSASHISRAGPRLMEGELPAAMGLLVQLAFRETREQVKDIVYPSPLSWIKGLKWGEYVGSPSSPDPAVCFSQPHGERFGSLLALPTRAICGLSRNFCLMMIYSKEQGDSILY